ncbi:MAG: nucleotidyl transferase AbiEii/AbiGii toxin family protein [Pseudohongiellaceae bacterium]
MDKVARLAPGERSELFSQTAANIGTTPAVVEKDFWVSWVLKRLYDDRALGKRLMFKGGTSLSKVYKLIQRFSEDIDLVLDWRQITDEDPFDSRSKTKQTKFNKEMMQRTEAYVRDTLFPEIKAMLSDVATCMLDDDKHNCIHINYPAAFADDYLRPSVFLEIGALSAWEPSETHQISCYAAEQFPTVFETTTCRVNVISAKRTFWDKATILHNECWRPENNPQNKGYSRHYYDLAKLAASPIKDEALNDLDLLNNVGAFKQQFFPHGWSRYELAQPGSFRLIPPDHVVEAVRSDYASMQNMFFGAVPTMDNVLQQLADLENEINQQKN